MGCSIHVISAFYLWGIRLVLRNEKMIKTKFTMPLSHFGLYPITGVFVLVCFFFFFLTFPSVGHIPQKMILRLLCLYVCVLT